jgi:hypothetical protein
MFQKHFLNIIEHRQQWKVTYELHGILLNLVVGPICGAEGREAIKEVAHDKQNLLKKYYPFYNGFLVHDATARVISAMLSKKL